MKLQDSIDPTIGGQIYGRIQVFFVGFFVGRKKGRIIKHQLTKDLGGVEGDRD